MIIHKIDDKKSIVLTEPFLEDIIKDDFSYPSYVIKTVEETLGDNIDDENLEELLYGEYDAPSPRIAIISEEYLKQIEKIMAQYELDRESGKVKEDIYTAPMKSLAGHYLELSNSVDTMSEEEFQETVKKFKNTNNISQGKTR